MATTYLRLSQLAHATRLPAAWLKREADAGRLPCVRAGRRLMFNLDAVVRALDARRESKVIDAQ